MAANDVQISIIGRDQATSAFTNVARAAEQTTSSVEHLGSGVSSLNSILSNTASYAMAIAGVNGLGEALHATLGEALDFYTTMQTGAVSMAGTLMSMGQIGGETISWNDSLAMSKQLMMELSDQALVTGASTKEISETFRAMLPNALNAGMTIDQTMKLASTLTTTGKALNLNGNILARDVQDLISGNNVQRSKLGIILGLTNEDIAQAKQSADGLFKFLQDRLKGEIVANQNYLNTLEGRWNHFKESVTRMGGIGLSPLLNEGTDVLTDLANKLVLIDDNSKEVIGLNPSVIEGFRDAGIVVMHIGEQIKQFGNDISFIAVPALKLLGGTLAVAAEHGATLAEVLIGMWVARGISSYVADYRNGLTGAAEAQTFLGKAAAQTRIQIEEQTIAAQKAAVAQRQATIAAAQVAISSQLAGTGATMETAAVARITGETNLAAAIQRNVIAENERTAAIERTRVAFSQAFVQMAAGQEEIAAGIVASNLSLEEEGAAAEMMARRMVQATSMAELGQYKLAEAILASTVALDEQGASAIVDGGKTAEGATIGTVAQRELTTATGLTTAASAEAGLAASAAGAKTVTAGATALTAVKNLTGAAFALVGGWVGVAAAIGYALYKLYEYADAEVSWEKDHKYWYNGSQWIVDRRGNVTNADANVPTMGDYTGVGAADTVSEEDKQKVLELNAQHEKELKEQRRKQEIENQKEEMKRGLETQLEMMKDPSLKALMEKVNGAYGKKDDDKGPESAAAKQAEKAAQQMAQANQNYAHTIAQNAETIRKANEKIENIIASLDEKILEQTGTQYDIDIAKIKKEYMSTIKSINDSTVALKTFSAKDAMRMTGGSYSTADVSGQIEGLTDETMKGLSLIFGYAQKLGIEGAVVTGGKEYGPHAANGWHPTGQGADIGWGGLEWGDPKLAQLGEYARQFFQEIKYDPHGTGPHLHVGGTIDNNIESALNASANAQQQAAQAQTDAAQAQNLAAQGQSAVPQTEAVQVITAAAKQLGFADVPLLLAIAARESGGDNVADIDMNAYNRRSGAAGMFQILGGQDVATADGRASISDLYPNYKTDPMQNALAGITMLVDKINAAGGDIWEGVKKYGENTDEYVNQIKANRDSLGGNVNLAPTAYTRYTSPLAPEARDKAMQYRTIMEQKALQDLLIRQRKQAEETYQVMAQYELLDTAPGVDQRQQYIQAKAQAEINANNDKWKEYYKQTGNEQSSRAYLNALNMEAEYKKQSSLRELAATEHSEWQQHLADMGDLQNDYEKEIDIRRRAELASYIEYQKQELQTDQLTTADRLKLEQQLVESMKQLRTIQGKTEWGTGIENLGRSMKSYTQDITGSLTEGWNNMAQSMEGAFNNMLTTNESFADRLKNLYTNIGNEILNVVMKIIMQGIIMNSVMKIFGMGSGGYSFGYGASFDSMYSSVTGGGAYLPSAFSYSHGITGFASGGYAPAGYILAGEEGPELIRLGASSYVNNARDTATILSNAVNANGTAGVQSVEVQVVNKSGQEVKATTSEAKLDGKKLIISTLLEAVATNYMGTRDMLKGATK